MASDAIPAARGPRLARSAIARLAILCFMTYAVPGNAVMGAPALDSRAEQPGAVPAAIAWARIAPKTEADGIDARLRRSDEAGRPATSTPRSPAGMVLVDRAHGEESMLQPDAWLGLIGFLALSALALGAAREAWRTRDGRLEEAARRCERERMARTLHDTLLQGTQGFILLAGAATGRMAPDDPARPLLEQALRQAEALMAEGRDRIQQLRTTDEPERDLPAKLARIGRELAGQNQERFRLDVEGQPRLIQPHAADEAVLIGREALTNAFRHAGANSVRVRLRYAHSHLQLTVSDDGCGIGADLLSHEGARGHWGVPGMTERAAMIPARLVIRGHAGEGTLIDLHIASGVSYCPREPLPALHPPMVKSFHRTVLRLIHSCADAAKARTPLHAIRREA